MSIARESLQKWISPHPSLVEERERRRAQLLSILTLLTAAFALAGGIVSSNFGIFLVIAGFSLLAYILSRTRIYSIGAYIFTYSLTSIAYIRIYLGSATSVDAAISTSVHIALVLASALLSQGGFLVLVTLATIATFSAPLYSSIPIISVDNIPRSGGVVLTIGILLYGVDLFLESLDRIRLSKLKESNLELEDIKINLERRVNIRTAELADANRLAEKRAQRLQSISEISQGIAENVNQGYQELLSFITRSISQKTGYYHVGLFLLDENREYAVLRSANSPGGLRMLEAHHQLRVGGTGIVGYVAQSGRPRVALDTGKDAIFFNNPDLPETRSEMALPLKVGSGILGVLDLQSYESSAFTDEDVTILSTLANQIAIIIQNFLLRMGGEPGELNLPSMRHKPRLVQPSRARGFTYLPDGTLSSSTKIEDPLALRVFETGETAISNRPIPTGGQSMTVPVKYRDRVIGIISIEAAEGQRKWTEDEVLLAQAVSERAALALENASLFEQAEKRAEQERLISDVTSRIGDSKDVERILHTTIQELGRILGTTRTFIQLGTPIMTDEEQSPDFSTFTG